MISYTAFTITCDPASLASSTTKVAGVESAAISNVADLFDDVLISGKITTGTTPTVNKTIDVWVYSQIDDTPTYPDVLDGTTSLETLTSENVRNAALVLIASIVVDATSNITYPMAPVSLAAAFGGRVPKRWGLFVVHDTVAALHATAGNHGFAGLGIKY